MITEHGGFALAGLLAAILFDLASGDLGDLDGGACNVGGGAFRLQDLWVISNPCSSSPMTSSIWSLMAIL